MTLDVTMQVPDGADQVELALRRSYLDKLQVNEVTPDPAEVRGSGDDLIFSFPLEPGTPELAVSFDLTGNGMGGVSGELGTVGSAPLSFSQFLYP